VHERYRRQTTARRQTGDRRQHIANVNVNVSSHSLKLGERGTGCR